MKPYSDQVTAASEYIRSRLPIQPRVGLVTGTGLAGITPDMESPVCIAYNEIPYFPASTVTSHQGRLVCGRCHHQPVAVLQGRVHLYEGYSAQQVAFPVRVLQQLGVRCLILTNAAGGLNPDFAPGDVMILADHINLTGDNPLIGPNRSEWGPRFPDMTRVYARSLAAAAETAGRKRNIRIHRGVYAGLKGPSLETPAEIRYLKIIGADAVGLSTVMEAIAAVHAGMDILGLSTITNLNDPDDPSPATVEEIIAVANAAAPLNSQIISDILESIDATLRSA